MESKSRRGFKALLRSLACLSSPVGWEFGGGSFTDHMSSEDPLVASHGGGRARPHPHPDSGAEVAAEAMPSPSASPDVLTPSLLQGWKQTQKKTVVASPALGETSKGGGSCIIILFYG